VNISHVVENLNRGGLERVVIELVKAQVAAGHDCQVVCLYDRGGLAVELDAIGVPVVACHKRTGLDLPAMWRLRRALRRHRTAVLHSHNSIPHYYAVLSGLGIRFRRVINTRHGMGDYNASSRREWLFRQSMRLTDVAASVAEAALARLAATGAVPADKLVAVPNGIHPGQFRPANAQARDALARELGFPAGTLLVGFVGRLNWAKDLCTLIEAFALLHRQRDDVALVLVGDGDQRQALQACVDAAGITGRVVFLGDRGDVPALLTAFDVFAMSSISEGYSIALLEASASALPIVTTRVGGNGEIVQDGITGRLVPARDAPALAAALADVLADPQRRAAMAAAARAWLLEHGTFQAMAARYQRLYEHGLG
jgi:glycosyltransferase involved in cell wall biosynthesis